MADAEREIKDMDNLISDLRATADSLDGAIDRDHLAAIINVIEEWEGYTKDCIQEMIDKLNV